MKANNYLTLLQGIKIPNGYPLIFPMVQAALSSVPFHSDTSSIDRYVPKDFPLHIAVHRVSPIKSPPPIYTQSHVHDDSDEVNIIISEESLVYKIQLDEEDFIVSSNSCIWIPRGVFHSANVVQGSGYFIALRVNQYSDY